MDKDLDNSIFRELGRYKRHHFTTMKGTPNYYLRIVGQNGCHDLCMLNTLPSGTLVDIFQRDGRRVARLPAAQANLKFL